MKLSISTNNDLLMDPLTGETLFGLTNNDWRLTQSIKRSLQTALDYLKAFVTDVEFATQMNLAYGASWNAEVAQFLAQQWLSNNFTDLPKIEVRPSAEINGANGAFARATNRIYLSHEFITQNPDNSQAIVPVLLEEIGHYFDWRLNSSDTLGDEGAIFAALAQGADLTNRELSALKAEDDSATIMLNGQAIAIEQAVPIVTLSVNDSYAAETLSKQPANRGSFTVKRNVVTKQPLTVFYHISGTAIKGTDYNTLSGSIIIPKGKATAQIPITVKNDSKREATEQVTLILKDGSNYNLGNPKTGKVSIIDNDTTVVITDPDPNSPGPGFPNNLTPDETYKVTYDDDSNAWETATKSFDGKVQISVIDDPYFDGSSDELFPIDETYTLKIEQGSLGFTQETYTVNEAIGTATIALIPTSKIKTATFNIQDDDWNDSFSKAISLNKVGADSGNGRPISSSSTNVGATKQSGERNHAGNSSGDSIWWKWKAAESGGVDVSATSLDFNTVLSVYTGTSVSNLTEVVSNSNDGPVSFDAVTGTTYYIAVDGNTGTTPETGDIFLDLTPKQQTFNQSDALPLPITDLGTVTSALSVNDLTGTVADVNLKLDIAHTWDTDLDVFLVSPVGTKVVMFQDVGGSGDNFTFTTFNDEALTSISSGAAPFTDSFKPQELLSTFDGQNPNGTWTLEITDDSGTNIGTLNNWSLSLSLTTA